MAKVTRTITFMKALVLCADSERGELVENYYSFTKSMSDNKIKKEVEKDGNLIFVKVKEKELVSEKFVMDADEFIKYAKKVEEE